MGSKAPARSKAAVASGKSGPKWTDEQRAAIYTTGKSLLVSAAAGSGKTAVLAERCAYLVCDAPDPCDVDELLVVTFTEAAAAEMKARIQKSIRERISADPNPRLARQLALIDRAQVSTLHGFCARLIRQHFHLLGLDPAFAVMDGDESSLLRTEIARQLFADRYESDSEGKFQAFVDAYGDGNDERLLHQVIATHELLCSLIDPAAWIARAKGRIDEACSGKLEHCDLGKELLALVNGRLGDVLERCRDAYRTLSKQSVFAKYTQQLKELGLTLRHWQEVLKSDGLDALCEAVTDLQLPKLPPMSNSIAGKDAAKALVDGVREELKDGKLRTILRFNCEQWTEGMRSMCDSAGVFLSLVEEFGKRYRREKDAARAVDFSDLERMALDALRDRSKPGLEPSNVARLLHRQFKHVLVDEYQDINEVQDAILALASTECLVDAPAPMNLFTVGDVKQSIYRFRLAEPHRFLERHEKFRNGDKKRGEVIDLQTNFRSRGPLLSALNEVFGRLMTKAAADIEYDSAHRLNPGLPYPSADGAPCFNGAPIELHVLPRDVATGGHEEEADTRTTGAADEEELDRSEREALLIARRILAITGRDGSKPMHVMEKKDGVMAPRAAKLSDIVILLRSMRYKADRFADVLRASGIPVHSESGTGYFDSMEVRDVLALLKVLDNRKQDVPLASFLRSPMAGLPGAEDALARIRLEYPAYATGLPFYDAVIRYSTKDDELAAKLKGLIEQLDRWREMAQRRPLAELLWDIYDSTGYLAFCAGLADGEQRVANLIDLFERARQFGSFHRQGLARFLSFLDSLQSESDLGQPSVVSGAEDVVRVMSIHRSKGLEFPIVILPDLGKAVNLSDCSGSILVDRHAYLGMSAIDERKQIRYPSLASVLVETRLRQQALAEELRVLYVAMTRAREHLILVGTCSDSRCESWTSRFAGHVGAFSADTVLSARTMLDWIGPVSAASPDVFEVHRHTAEEMSAWPSPQAMRPAATDREQKLARLEPIDPAPEKNATADAVLARLSWRYPFEEFTKAPAALSVSALTKEDRPTYPAAAPALEQIEEFNTKLELPRALVTDAKPDAADVGSATHLLLQHLDFTRACDEADLRRQIDNLLDRRLISKAAAGAVDLASICWVAGSDVGKLIRKHFAQVRRELPIAFAMDPPDAPVPVDPEDRIMIRSRLDVVVPTEAGIEIVDYKTDRVTETTIQERIKFYRPQMDFYRQAIRLLLGKQPAKIHLVFLHPRQIHTF